MDGLSPAQLADPVLLTQMLLRCESVTPADGGSLHLIASWGARFGFDACFLPFGPVNNLSMLRPGSGGRGHGPTPHLGFAGHVDVVPAGDLAAWTTPPFSGALTDACVWGRGAVDMKGAIAAFMAAVAGCVNAGAELPALSFLLTSDEEGPGIDGTVRVLPELGKSGRLADHYLVGEPTSEDRTGDIVKNGRRGSLNGVVTVMGAGGHVAYPALAHNPVPILLDLLGALRGMVLDDGAPDFDPSNLEITSIDVGNPTHNVIPAKASARFNIRFNICHRGEDLVRRIEELCAADAAHRPDVRIVPELRVKGEPFRTPPGPFTALLLAAGGGRLSTSGGTSDARFIARFRPCAELGLRNALAHKPDERVPVSDLLALKALYSTILRGYPAVAG